MEDSNDPTIFSEVIKKIKHEEIIEDLDNFGVQLNPKVFSDPKPDHSLGLYSLAIQVVFGKTDRDIRPEELYGKLNKTTSKFKGADFSSENVDFLKSGIKNLRLWRYCQKLHSILGLKEIKLYELFNPTPESFSRFINAFLVYLRFTDALHSLFQVSLSNLDSLAERELRLMQDTQNLLEENEKFKRVISDNSEEIASLLKDKHDLESKLLRSNEEFTNLKNRKKELDLETGRVRNLLNDTMLSKSKAKYTFDDLSEHFTTNLDTANNLYNQLKSEESSQRVNLETLSSKVDGLKTKYSDLLESCGVFDRLKRNLSDHYRDVVLPHVENLEFSKKALGQMKKANQRIKELTNKRDALLTELERKKKTQEEVLNKLREESQNRIDQANKIASESRKANELVQKKVKEVRDMTQQVNDKVLETRNNSLELFSILDERLEALREPVRLYNERINTVNSILTEAPS